MVQSNFKLTDYDFYSESYETELVTSIVESLNKIIEEDKKEKQPLFIRTTADFVSRIAKKVVKDRAQTFLIGIAGESASGKTTFVDNTVKACIKDRKEGIYTVVRCDDYFKDTSKELIQAGSYEALFKSGFSFDTPDALDLHIMKEHLIELKKLREITSPKYDFVTCESCPQGELKKPAKIILSEGLYVLGEELKNIMDIKVYVYTPLEVIKDRWYKRAATRGKIGNAADLQFQIVNEAAQKHIRPSMHDADVIINGLVSVEYIEFITDRIFKAIAEACYV